MSSKHKIAFDLSQQRALATGDWWDHHWTMAPSRLSKRALKRDINSWL